MDGKRYSKQGKTKRQQECSLTSDERDFNSKTVTRDKENHYMMIMGSDHQENITTVNLYASNI